MIKNKFRKAFVILFVLLSLSSCNLPDNTSTSSDISSTSSIENETIEEVEIEESDSSNILMSDPLESKQIAEFHDEGLYIFRENGKYGVVDIKKKTIIPFEYDLASDYNFGVIAMYKTFKYGFKEIPTMLIEYPATIYADILLTEIHYFDNEGNLLGKEELIYNQDSDFCISEKIHHVIHEGEINWPLKAMSYHDYSKCEEIEVDLNGYYYAQNLDNQEPPPE